MKKESSYRTTRYNGNGVRSVIPRFTVLNSYASAARFLNYQKKPPWRLYGNPGRKEQNSYSNEDIPDCKKKGSFTKKELEDESTKESTIIISIAETQIQKEISNLKNGTS